MDMTDLFPGRLGHHLPPTHSRIPATDLLKIIADEALTVGLIAGWFLDGREIEVSDFFVCQINETRESCQGNLTGFKG